VFREFGHFLGNLDAFLKICLFFCVPGVYTSIVRHGFGHPLEHVGETGRVLEISELEL
jgi:hypothetical protein